VRIRRSQSCPGWASLAAVAAVTVLAGCGGHEPSAPTSSTDVTPTRAAPAPSTALRTSAGTTPSTKNWFDLQAGDCVMTVPQVDLGEVTVSTVDCGTAHQAEVYLRAPVEVNAAIADVADRQCAAGLSRYTGRPGVAGPFVATYLIDSNQDRTVDDPLPSTVICLLQSADGRPLTGSAKA
jgi:hypothetical protein